ncbi:MAG: hypothetical protein E7438_03635 [Ruminococcaceae bacterium]|nr:hypothetical protein [Oscillospiraceae bacterium]
MKLKKLLCLLLALLLVCSMAACGESADQGGDKDPDQDPTTPTTTVPPEDDTVWVLTKEYDGDNRYTLYYYDAEGNLIGGEYYSDNKKWGDYQFVTTPTEDGGKIVEKSYKNVKDTEYSKQYSYEYNAEGKLIRVEYIGKFDYSCWTFAYDADGNVTEALCMNEEEQLEKVTYTYQDGKLYQVNYYKSEYNWGIYTYTYDADGFPVKIEIENVYAGEPGQETVELVRDEDRYGWQIDQASGGKLIKFSIEDRDGEPYERILQFYRPGIFMDGWLPTVMMGCMDTADFTTQYIKLCYMPLEVNLSLQDGK